MHNNLLKNRLGSAIVHNNKILHKNNIYIYYTSIHYIELMLQYYCCKFYRLILLESLLYYETCRKKN